MTTYLEAALNAMGEDEALVDYLSTLDAEGLLWDLVREALGEVDRLRDFQRAKEKTVEGLKQELDRARELEESAKAVTRRLQEERAQIDDALRRAPPDRYYMGQTLMDAMGRPIMHCPDCGRDHPGEAGLRLDNKYELVLELLREERLWHWGVLPAMQAEREQTFRALGALCRRLVVSDPERGYLEPSPGFKWMGEVLRRHGNILQVVWERGYVKHG
jgi:hypothetical protein